MADTNPRNIHIRELELYFIPIQTRVPLKFGTETLTTVTCARVKAVVGTVNGQETATGWGETPLNVQWVWPSSMPYQPRLEALMDLCRTITAVLLKADMEGHPMETGYDFTCHHLKEILHGVNRERIRGGMEPVPWLAALVCFSACDIAVHDAYGVLHGVPVYQTYDQPWMNRDLSAFLEPSRLSENISFSGVYPGHFLLQEPRKQLKAWHLVGGLDPLTGEDLTGDEPDDGYPVQLEQWIESDGLDCLKIKLRGTDEAWDFDRMSRTGAIAGRHGVHWLSADFNCTVRDPDYVNRILDRLRDEEPETYARLLYVEQPFPHELEEHRLNVRSVSARKPLFLDESAHDWGIVRLGFELGWTGVALKTCKTQTGAILSACWAIAHGMTLMVQDLTNPMLAQIPHCLLAAHLPTIMGVETNGMQFYPEASALERNVHPGLYQRRNGLVDLSTLGSSGFGYRVDEIGRALPEPEPLS
jgi:L-alanine-DL-glutamate epimerase-like enolase superfamily enzyme